MSGRMHDATLYVQLAPEFWTFASDTKVRAIKAVAMTQKRPERPKPGTVTAKLTIRVPETAFLPLQPEAVIVVPEDMVAANLSIEVEAGDPS